MRPTGSFERLALTVSGPDDFSFTKEFPAAAAPVLRLQDLGAKADGSYSWELRVIPRIAAETKSDQKTPGPGKPESTEPGKTKAVAMSK